MKIKHLFIAILLIGTSIVSCSDDDMNEIPSKEFIVIPDINFETELINQGIDSDGIINQKVLKDDVKNIDYLDLSNTSSENDIEDLTGIEGFTNLKRLYAIGNRLKEIDISNNNLLDTLHLMSNDLKSIKGLSKATNLKWINLSYNLFEEFTLDNASVTNILMSDNNLTHFDASAATNLETVFLLTNKLTTVDFTQNLKLEAIDVSNNKLTDIILGEKEALYYLSLFQNFLTNLNVSNLNKLDFLKVDRNPYLTCVKIKNNQYIPTLRLSVYQQVNTDCNLVEDSYKFIGTVVDNLNNPINNAVVTLGTYSTTADINGEFLFEINELETEYAYLKAEKNEYITGLKMLNNLEEYNTLKFTLLKDSLSTMLGSGGDSVANFPTGLVFKINGNIKYEDGNPFSGFMYPVIHHIVPNNPAIESIIPGNSIVDENNYGFVYVKLEDGEKNWLDIADGHAATLEFDIHEDLLPTAPETIKVYNFNEETGLWVLFGTATKTIIHDVWVYQTTIASFKNAWFKLESNK